MRQSLIRYEVEGVGSVEFGRTPPRFLNQFDGSSVGSSAISYKAIGLHGEKDVGVKLEPRTISADVTIVGMDSAGKYSREKLVVPQAMAGTRFSERNSNTRVGISPK